MGDFDIKGIWKEFSKDKGNWRFGLYCGIFLTILIIFSISYGNINLPLFWTSSSYDIGLGEKQFYIHQNNNVLASMDVLNISGECIDIKLNYKNGQYYSGNFCEGQTFNLENWLVKIDEILIGTNLNSPIKISSYLTLNLRGLFIFLMFIIPIIAISDKINQLKQRKQDEDYKKKRKQLAKKFKVKEDDINDLLDFASETMEE